MLIAGWLLSRARGLWRWHAAPPWLQQHFQELAGSQGARGWGDSSHPAQPSLPQRRRPARQLPEPRDGWRASSAHRVRAGAPVTQPWGMALTPLLTHHPARLRCFSAPRSFPPARTASSCCALVDLGGFLGMWAEPLPAPRLPLARSTRDPCTCTQILPWR